MATRLQPGFLFLLLLVVMASAWWIPTFVEDPDELRTATETISEGGELQVYHALNVSVSTTVNNDNVTLTVKNTDLGLENETTILQGTEEDVIVGDDTVTINATDVTSNDATLDITYRATFGWPATLKNVAANLGIIFMALTAMVVIGLLFTKL